MCGIHLIWGKGAHRESIQTLVDSSRHRGPDQEAVYSPWPGLWIGVNRLKILHPGPDADQPFWAPDSKSLLILNGEIYNFKELRSMLSKMGIDFITQSDTEVLLHYLRSFGPKGLEKLNGMFSLIFVDLITKSVLVARDGKGEKPLYYAQNPETLVISSEMSGIGKLQEHAADWDQVEHFFHFRFPSPGKTFFRGIREWKPGRYSSIFRHDTFRWDTISPPEMTGEIKEENFRQALYASILRQFHADVPVGMMLSGGADSSLLYALWYRHTGTRLPAYSIQVEKKYRNKYADGDASTRFVKQVPADHQLIEIDQSVFFNNWDDYLQSLDLPVGDSAGFLTWMIGKSAKNQVKVLISGAGADELWGGYQRHKAFLNYWEHPIFWIKWAEFLEKIPMGRAAKKFLSGIRQSPQQTFLNFFALQNPPVELMGDYERIFNPNLPEYRQILDFDRQVYLVHDVLKILDNALMAHGIEGRSPYLDSSMLGISQRIVDSVDLIGKPWIKNYLRDLDLAWVAERKKFGFGLPLQEWLGEKGEFSNRVYSTLREFDRSHGAKFTPDVRQILANPKAGAQSHFLSIYNLFLLAEWTKLHRL